MNTPDSTTQQSRFRSLLNENRDMALVFLSAQLNDLFGSSDEALLDFAEQAENNAMQGRFFEAVGAVRRYRPDIEHLFRQEVTNGFNSFGESSTSDMQSDEPLELSLVEQDEMEEAVASENLVLKNRSNYAEPLYALEQRLAVLNNGHKIDETQIPSGPTHLVQSFRAAISVLQIDVKAKIILYALMDKFIMRQLKGLYDEFNGNLKNAGILPNLKPAYFRAESPSPGSRPPTAAAEPQPPNSHPIDGYSQPPSQAGAAPGQQEASGSVSLGEELFTSILDLMSSRRQGGPGSPPHPAGAAAYPRARPAGIDSADNGWRENASPGPAGQGSGGAGQQQLLSAIDTIRPRSLNESGGVLSNLDALPQIAVDPNFVNNLKQTIAREREQIFSQVDSDELQAVDTDTIDLIGMLFEYMLNDPLLPNVAKALLSHLHTPYLKLSLTDRQLLVDSEHPARLLLDMLVEAGGQWVYENDIKRGIFPQMRTTVDRVLQESFDNPDLFGELLDYFKVAMDEQRRRSDAIEQRAQESVKGREKLHVAKQRATQEMQARIQTAAMPKAASRFLSQAWTDRLVFILLRHQEGEQSEDWARSLQLADDLLWLFDSDNTDVPLKSIAQTCEGIKQEIESALDSLGGYHQHYLNQLFEFLNNPATIMAWQTEQPEHPVSEPLGPDSDSLLNPPTTPLSAAESSAAAAARRADGQLSKQAQPFEKEAKDDAELSAREQDMVEKLQNLKFGTWFEFKDRPEGQRRLKLSWLSPLTSTCMFVDRAGAQAEVKSLSEVAKLLLVGRAKLIPRPKHQFVERALTAIKNALQRSMEATG